MKFTLEINLGNDAMQTSDDAGRALVNLGNYLRGFPDAFGEGEDCGDIRDENGNEVGSWSVTE